MGSEHAGERVDTREAMIAAAERLFAEHGMGAVSLRMVATAAGQRNNSAAHYHFGSREGLVTAIVEERLAPVNQRRAQLLHELDEEDRGNDVRALVEALVVPLVEATLERPASYYGRFLAVAFADPQWSVAAMSNPLGDVYVQWRRRLDRCLADVPVAIRRVRIDRAVFSVITAVALWESGRGTRGLSTPTLVADLIDTTVAALSATTSDRPAVAASATSRHHSIDDERAALAQRRAARSS